MLWLTPLLLLFCLAWPLNAHAATHLVKGSIGSSPTSGPVGATIAVSGSGWNSIHDGTLVTFGYSTATDCSSFQGVADSQPGTMSGGIFSGWFRWPLGTALGNYRVCATIGNQIVPSNTYTVLSTNQPQLSLSTTTFTVGQSVILSGSNYLPSGITVSLTLQRASDGSLVNLGLVNSDGVGSFSTSVAIPSSPPGGVLIQANVGSGPPTLSSSVTGTINATPGPTPTPGVTATPGATPTPAPTATPTVAPTATPTATSVPTATPTNVGSQTPVATSGPGIDGTSTPVPASGTGSAQNTTGNSTPASQQQSGTLIPIVAGGLTLLMATLGVGLLVWRRQKNSKTKIRKPIAAPIAPIPNMAPIPVFGYNTVQPPIQPVQSAYPPVNGGPVPSIRARAEATSAQRQYGAPPYAQPQPAYGAYPAIGGGSISLPTAIPRTTSAPEKRVLRSDNPLSVALEHVEHDLFLEAMMQQAQEGLFLLPEKQRGPS